MINIHTAVSGGETSEPSDTAGSITQFYGELAIGLGIAFVISTILMVAINLYFKRYKEDNMVIHPKAAFYKNLGIIGVYFIAALVALAKILI